MLFSVLIQRYTRNKSLLFFGCASVFWALYRLYPKKNPFFHPKKILLELIPEKKDFFIENKAFSGLILRYTRKKSFFLKFQKTVLAYTRLIFEKKSFFSAEQILFFLARPLNYAMVAFPQGRDAQHARARRPGLGPRLRRAGYAAIMLTSKDRDQK